MIIRFIENIERDIQNWQNSVIAKSYGVDWKNFLPKDIDIKDVKDYKFLKEYLNKNYYEKGEVSIFKNWLENNVDSAEIQTDLQGLMGKKFFKDVNAFITTFHRAPYDVTESFFYLILRDTNRKRSITNIYHELMHFLFHIHYWEICKKAGLSETQTHDLKESLTALLNPILKRRGLPLDFGYPNHQEFRASLEKLWNKGENFEIFLKKVLDRYSNI
jgi:hypothetical protein